MRALIKLGVAMCSFALAACGGGGDDSPAAAGPSAEGVYGGSLMGSPNNAFNLLVLENGEYWAIYGTQATPTSTFFVRGFVQGTGTSSNGSFTSSNAKDFGFSPAASGTVNASYDVAIPSISGTIAGSPGTVTFNGGAIPGATYNYNSPASLAAISGAWSLRDLTGANVALNVTSSGTFTATSSGCSFSGTVAPRSSGKNVFNLSLTFGAAPCVLARQSATGIALVYPLTSGARQLVVGGVDGTRTNGMVALGTR